jgi:hypothetical protein
MLTTPESLPSLTEFAPESELSIQAQRLIEYASKKGRLPNDFSKKSVVQQFDAVFEMIGGIPRLALWADHNPTQFYALYSKLIPAAAKIEATVLTPDEQKLKEMSVDDVKLLVLSKLQEGMYGLDPNPPE